MRHVAADALDLVRLAEQGGFDIAWAPEHHAVEFMMGPNPFTILTHWAAHVRRIRLGTAVIAAPYWHPIRLAGEAALFDVLSDGRLELGFGRGAYQYEFDRLAGGIAQERGGDYLRELIPAVKALWRGDYAHRGAFWSFPATSSAPKPVQTPHPPIWVAARDAQTFDWAVKEGAHIQSTPLTRPMSEVEVLGRRFAATLATNPGVKRPRFLMLRRTCVYEDPDDWREPIAAAIFYGRHFENLSKNLGTVTNGFPDPIDLSEVANRTEYQPDFLRANLTFGTPQEVVEKLRVYERAGVDNYCYGATFGLSPERARRSLELFITEVMPHFRDAKEA
jgi:alkanesulfonate monooxygenase SsuD/methylene tetrahydromethanopterin reductase-like flavin-dependent oxidoreductase (luciferase family)